MSRHVRVSVLGPESRADLTLPDFVPLAELLPVLLDLFRSAGTPLSADAHWRLTGPTGRPLPGASTAEQAGLLDGDLICLVDDLPAAREPVVDDLAVAVARDAAGAGRGWAPEHRGPLAAGLAVLLLAAAAGQSLLQPPGAVLLPPAALLAVAVAVGLDRLAGRPGSGQAVGAGGLALCAAAGWSAAAGPGAVLATAAGAGLLAAGLRRAAPLPAGVLAAVLPWSVGLAAGAAAGWSVGSAAVLAAVTALGALPTVPGVAAAWSGLTGDAAAGEDAAGLAYRAATGRRLVVALVAGLGAALLGCWAVLAAAGGAATALGLLAVPLVALHARRHRDRAARTALLGTAAAGVVLCLGVLGSRGAVPPGVVLAAELAGAAVLAVLAGWLPGRTARVGAARHADAARHARGARAGGPADAARHAPGAWAGGPVDGGGVRPGMPADPVRRPVRTTRPGAARRAEQVEVVLFASVLPVAGAALGAVAALTTAVRTLTG